MDHEIEQWLKSKIFKINMATSDVEIEDLQLLLESNICKYSSEKLEELAEHLELPIATYTGKRKLVISKLVRDKTSDGIESRETAEMKREYMHGLQNFLADEPPPLAEVAENSEGKTKDSEGKKVPVIDVNKIFRREFKIKGKIGVHGDESEYRRPPIWSSTTIVGAFSASVYLLLHLSSCLRWTAAYWRRFCGTSLWHPTSSTCVDGTTNCSFSHRLLYLKLKICCNFDLTC